MSPKMETTAPKELPPAVNNSSLFTDYYLAELLRDDLFFQKSKGEAKEAWKVIKTQYETVKGLLPTANEAETEHRLIRPVLDIIGYKDLYSLQPPVPSPEGIRRPDFAFFTSKEDLEEAEKHLKGKQEYFAKAVAVGDAKQWERSLDKKIKGSKDPFTNQNPSYQVDFYLRATDKTWGILANGRHWRLYHRDTSYRMDVFYEIDLPAMLREYDNSFLYFYAFFCKEALTSGFLDRAHKESREYVAKLGDELNENVYEALRFLAEGFLKFPENGLSQGDLEKIRANTFVLIYRLLFLFYAEDRGLLPLENPNYRSYSLRELASEIAERLDHGHAFSPTARGYWAKLQDLFHIVNEGDDLLSVPPYNGGLFDENKHPFLEKYKVGDLYLAKAIDQLARTKASGRTGRGPVSYRDPDVRHIGAIYEGLLEHHLRVADQETAVIKEKGREKFIPIAELNSRKALRTYQTGEVYLETDKGERKATGSYYTPHYIVQYIVRNTLEPLIEEKRKEIQRTKQELEKKVKQSRGYNREVYEKQLHKIGNRLIGEILSIKVLDPAMGSGHFLVEATDFLARELIRVLGESPDEVEEDESRWARREVVERCIFGVDLNPLAVELAKLSLWLYTVAKNRPLSFLDHHLRLGNSLIGAWVKDLGALPVLKQLKEKAAPEQIGLLESELKEKLPIVIGQVLKLLRMPSDRVEQIRQKEDIYDKILQILKPFKEVADVWASVYFGNEVTHNDYIEKLLFKLRDPSTVWKGEVCPQTWFAKGQEIAEEKHFFHWELEFPEAFFDRHGRLLKSEAGFDVIIGNPPYVSFGLGRTGKLPKAEERFYRAAFGCSAEYKISTYALFMEQGLAKCHVGGYESLIVPDSFLNGMYFSKIRGYLLQQSTLRYVVVFDRDFWESGDIGFPTIFVARKCTEHQSLEKQDSHFLHARVTEPEDLASNQIEYAKQSQRAQFKNPRMRFQLLTESAHGITWKMRECGSPLSDLLSMHHGIRSKVGRDQIITEDKLGPDWKKALVSGAEIHRHSIAPERHFIHVDPHILFSGGWNPDHIERDKMLIRRTGDSLICVVDVNGYYHTNALIYGVPTTEGGKWSLLALCSILNSKLVNFHYQSTILKTGRTLPQVEIDTLKNLPIRRIAFTTPKEERVQLAEEGKRLYFEALEKLRLENEIAKKPHNER